MRSLAILSLVLAGFLGATRALAQPCLGLPLEGGDHAVGALVETETGYTLLGGLYAGSSGAFAWRGHAGGVLEDFPGSWEADPAVGAGLAWIGWKPWTCPTVGVEHIAGDSERDVTTVTVGWGAGFSTLADSTRIVRAIVYVVPELRWIRRGRGSEDIHEVETESELAFEAGVTVASRRLWAGGGARLRHREHNDYPLDAIMLLRGGVRW